MAAADYVPRCGATVSRVTATVAGCQALPDSSVWSFGLMFFLHQETENTVHLVQAQWASGDVVTRGDKLSGEMSQWLYWHWDPRKQQGLPVGT